MDYFADMPILVKSKSTFKPGDEDLLELDFKTRGPVPVFVENDGVDYKTGCSVVDLTLADPTTVAQIRFKNYYSATMKLLCKRVPSEKDVKNRDTLPWLTSIKRIILMPNVHIEDNAQDLVYLNPIESMVPWSNIVHFRMILKQPSFQWKKFSIRELSLFKPICKESKQTSPHPMSHASTSSQCSISIKPDVKKTEEEQSENTKAQNILAVADVMEDKQKTGKAVGRFEVDGSYDISHLV